MRTVLHLLAASIGTLSILGAADGLQAGHVESSATVGNKRATQLILPIMNAERGKKVFVDKGCIACHAINGVGGHDASALDAHQMSPLMNPFDFAAKMWNHAPAMIAAQEGALGDQIYFTGAELADIIAFVHDDEVQHRFTEKDLTAKARKLMAHEHGGEPATKAHAGEIGHVDPPGARPHGH